MRFPLVGRTSAPTGVSLRGRHSPPAGRRGFFHFSDSPTTSTMTISLTDPADPPITSVGRGAPLRDGLDGMLASMQSGGEKRRQRRYAFPHLVYLTPVAEDGQTPRGNAVLAAGKHLSEGGIGFYHSQPLSDRRVIVTLELPHGERPSFLLELRWCRFIRHGWYESGGRFLRPTATPDACRAAAE